MAEGRMIHVVVEDGNPKYLGDVDVMQVFLEQLVKKLGMRSLGRVVVDVELDIAKLGVEPFEDEGGVTGCVVLSTSHIAAHSWPLRGLMQLTVYSCRPFGNEVVAAEVEAAFEPSSMRITDLSHALEFV